MKYYEEDGSVSEGFHSSELESVIAEAVAEKDKEMKDQYEILSLIGMERWKDAFESARKHLKMDENTYPSMAQVGDWMWNEIERLKGELADIKQAMIEDYLST